MRTGRTLTVFRIPVETPPWKIGDPPTPTQKIGDPPGTDLQGMLGYTPPPPLWTDRRLWKYYLGQNFVSAGKNVSS